VILSTALGEETVILQRGGTARLTHMAFQVGPDTDFAQARKDLAAKGIACEERTDVTQRLRRALSLQDPCGTQLDLFTDTRPHETVERPRGVVPLKLGHVAFKVADPKALVDFYTTVLGFRVSDWMGDYFAFLRCGPDHHTINFVQGKNSGLHHFAFELKDWGHVQSACELLGQKDIQIIWGPGRHGIGHNIFVYHRDPDDHIVEFYIEMDQMKDETLGYFEPRPWHKDRPQRPKVWERIPARMVWGTPPTEDFLRDYKGHGELAGQTAAKA
jgi:catechol 2,3-dioxygenase-like lactoylglutathione lyase family enzyme